MRKDYVVKHLAGFPSVGSFLLESELLDYCLSLTQALATRHLGTLWSCDVKATSNTCILSLVIAVWGEPHGGSSSSSDRCQADAAVAISVLPVCDQGSPYVHVGP